MYSISVSACGQLTPRLYLKQMVDIDLVYLYDIFYIDLNSIISPTSLASGRLIAQVGSLYDART